jgi:uncharacterized membrane protein
MSSIRVKTARRSGERTTRTKARDAQDDDDMDKMLVAVFEDESKAYEGVKALDALAGEGSIARYATAVIAKDEAGNVAVKQAADRGPLGTGVGLLVGTLAGLAAGPAGAAVGAATGGLVGSIGDLFALGLGQDFLDDVGRELAPGKAAVVAEVWEEWITPVDSRLTAAGGKVLRRPIAEVEDALIQRDVDAFEAEVKSIREEHAKAKGDAKSKLAAKMKEIEAKAKDRRERAKKRIDDASLRANAKLDELEKQSENARGEMKEKIDGYVSDVREANRQRREELKEAWRIAGDALSF